MSILRLIVAFVLSLFKYQRQLFLENLALRQQVGMLQQAVQRPHRVVSGAGLSLHR
jgi:hypothetical protein